MTTLLIVPSTPEPPADRGTTTPRAGTASLRDRKRLRARRDLQRAAIDMVEERGYAATTIDDICTVAEVSRSSFFRYFGTKEAVFGADLIAEETEAVWREPRTRTLDDLCELICTTYQGLSAEDYDLERRRIAILGSVPELRPYLADEILRPFPLMVGYVAAMLDMPATSVRVHTMAGAVVGILAGRFLPVDDQPVTLPATLDEAIAAIREAFADFAALAPQLAGGTAPSRG